MIKGIAGGIGVAVNGGDTALPYVPMNDNNPIQGMIRVHGVELQAFNGSSWTAISSSYATVNLDATTQDILAWAREQRDRDRDRALLAKTHPALQKALEAIQRAEDNFDLLSKFVEHDGQV